MMKCPHCGAETPDGTVCSRCGRDLQSRKGIEVHYKDFKVTEMLDIKIPSRVPRQEEPEDPLPSPRKAEESGSPFQRPGKPAARKPVVVLIAGVIVLFAAAAWFLLLKFIFKF